MSLHTIPLGSDPAGKNAGRWSFTCRTIKIGSYKYNPREKVTISSKGVKIIAPLLKNESYDVAMQIEEKEIVKILAQFSKGVPVIFLYTTSKGAMYIRKVLDMTDESGPYYNPMSKVDPQMRITLLPDAAISDEVKVAFKSLFGKTVDELDPREAHEILKRHRCKRENYAARVSGASHACPRHTADGPVHLPRRNATVPRPGALESLRRYPAASVAFDGRTMQPGYPAHPTPAQATQPMVPSTSRDVTPPSRAPGHSTEHPRPTQRRRLSVDPAASQALSATQPMITPTVPDRASPRSADRDRRRRRYRRRLVPEAPEWVMTMENRHIDNELRSAQAQEAQTRALADLTQDVRAALQQQERFLQQQERFLHQQERSMHLQEAQTRAMVDLAQSVRASQQLHGPQTRALLDVTRARNTEPRPAMQPPPTTRPW